ncbi:helix-turn-helix domain-containing protein [Actinokineospora globicatena]|uniref:AraC family transcriptional regulator n=1 Tax=Actinokineospora globicatena TaxID=103729 RepID=A0A9W6VDC1_9PSEU|nr:helix-turn-helix domain-containing protein [Actinokineospora globicatena]MCP2306276.1 AraC-type DNA-binding protein [Actinokineospora globicatena]GLW81700.1 AraC family transcriptional regulator [Actinokineospora globicatena]GLW88495.1 AraC family transcriptional regulator [Actinokineospora globicatena]GLW95121.1 AraC family transcriptional regulator [Actinokineospora globicatena]
MTYSVTTAGAPAAQQFDLWESAVSQTFVPLEAAPGERAAFRGRLRGQNLGSVAVYEATADAHTVRRTQRAIARANPEMYKLGLQLHGTARLSQDGRQAALDPGDFAIYDTTRPYTLAFDDVSSTLVLMFPRDMLCLPSGHVEQLTATRFSGVSGVSGIVSSILVQLARNLDDPQVYGSVRLARNVVDLLGTALADRVDYSNVPAESTRGALLVKIKSYVETHLNDPALSPTEIAAAHHISTRYLHKLFSDAGVTVSGWIRQRRLERCGQDLADPAKQQLAIGTIGARWGLVDASYLSRAFKTEYGLSPSEYRQRSATHRAD